MKTKITKLAVSLLSVIFILFALTACGNQNTAKQSDDANKVLKLGVIQIVEHPSLDAARNGFLEVLQENGYIEGENLQVDFQNAQGDMPTAKTIANKFVSDKKDIILAIATPTSQAIAGTTKDIPILITAVTDPVAAGLVKSMERPGTNVTGTTDMAPVKEQLALLKEIKPEIKRVGILYNTSETNSVVQVEIAEKAAKELGLELVKSVANNSSEVLQAAQALIGRVDGIYVPGDNTVVSALESVIQVANNNKLPLVVSEGDSVRRGALATLGLDYYKLGRQTGEMAIEVLNGRDPAKMPIQSQRDLNVVVNLKAAVAMGIEIPKSVIDKASEIIE
jgi:putative ABC transport system substrate-binding protein